MTPRFANPFLPNRLRWGLCAALALVVACLSWPAEAEESPAAAPPEAAVVFANRPVAVLRAPFLGISPERRAQRAEAALREMQAQRGGGQVTVQVERQGHALMVDGELAFVLTAADADGLRGQTLAQASAAARDALALALSETREARDTQRLLKGLGSSLLAILAASVAIALTWAARRWASARLTTVVARRGAAVHVAGAQLLQADRLAAWVGVGLRALSWVVVLALGYECLSFVMGQFPYTRPWAESLTSGVLGVASRLGRAIVAWLPDLAIAVAIFFIARGVLGALRPFFARVEAAGTSEHGWLDADTARPTQRLLTVAVWVFALVMAYPYLPGSGSEAFKGMSVLIGVMVTIGGSSVFGQAMSGLVLMYARTLRVGDYVRIDTHEGTVTDMGAFVTRIRTGLGEELTMPNSLVLGTVTKNYSRVVNGRGFVLDTTVTIGYDTPWRQVEALLVEAARRTTGVLPDPAPRVFHTALSDFYPEYRLVCLATPVRAEPRAAVLSLLHANIQDVFNEFGVQIMSPHYLGDPATAKVVPKQDWYAAPAQAAAEPGAARP